MNEIMKFENSNVEMITILEKLEQLIFMCKDLEKN